MAGHPRVRTFHTRRGRHSPAQRADIDAALARCGLPAGPIDPSLVFGRRAPLVLEIGCGLGHAALAFAAARPDHDLIAADVHTPGVARLLRRVEADGLANVRVVEGCGLDVLDRFPPAGLAAVHVFFPDPWPKRAHHKRRLVRPDVVAVLADRLEPGGRLLFATDDAGYAAHADVVVAADGRFDGGPSERPAWRPRQGYEARAAGRPVHERAWRRRTR